MDPYRVLGLPRDASATELRRAYLRLARAHHPDRFADAPAARQAEAERRMQELTQAWSLVGDERRRRQHDARADPRPAEEADLPFQPFDESDGDDVDPLDLPDAPYHRSGPAGPSRGATMTPILVFAGSVAAGVLGLVLDAPGLLGLAFVLFVASCVGFVVLPLLALARAARDEG
jgi:curved DNA-binding protein CbpA